MLTCVKACRLVIFWSEPQLSDVRSAAADHSHGNVLGTAGKKASHLADSSCNC